MAKEKLDRQRIIRDLIRNGRIANQEELSSKLQELGLIVAQATLSRDIKEMQISKLHDDEGYYYSLARPAFVRKGGSLAMEHRVLRCHGSHQDKARLCQHGGCNHRFQGD